MSHLVLPQLALNVIPALRLSHCLSMLSYLIFVSLTADERQLHTSCLSSSYPALVVLSSLIHCRVRWWPHPTARWQDSSVLLERVQSFVFGLQTVEPLVPHSWSHTHFPCHCQVPITTILEDEVENSQCLVS